MLVLPLPPPPTTTTNKQSAFAPRPCDCTCRPCMCGPPLSTCAPACIFSPLHPSPAPSAQVATHKLQQGDEALVLMSGATAQALSPADAALLCHQFDVGQVSQAEEGGHAAAMHMSKDAYRY